MTRQREHVIREKAAGAVYRSFKLNSATVAALRELRARGAVSDAAAVNLAVQAAAASGGFLRALSDAVAREEATR